MRRACEYGRGTAFFSLALTVLVAASVSPVAQAETCGSWAIAWEAKVRGKMKRQSREVAAKREAKRNLAERLSRTTYWERSETRRRVMGGSGKRSDSGFYEDDYYSASERKIFEFPPEFQNGRFESECQGTPKSGQ